jgi:hypothetical protein
VLASRRRRAIAAVPFVVAALAALPGSASAAVGDMLFRECHSENGSAGACQDDALVATPYQVAVSPDGRHAYATSFNDPAGGALTTFDRNPTTGGLTQRSGTADCYRDAPAGGDCTDVESMADPLGVIVSADGDHVYVAAWGSHGVTVFNRDSGTGRLTQKAAPNGCIKNTGDGVTCKAGRALGNDFQLFPSPDGKNIYVTAQTGGGAIAILSVNADGELSQQQNIDGCVTENGTDGAGHTCTDGTQIGLGVQLAIAPDGSHVYGASSSRNAITLFNRDQATGGLTQKNDPFGCISQTGSPDPNPPNSNLCQVDAHVSNPLSVRISPDGRFVYALSGNNPGSVIVFARARPADGGNGLLTFSSCVHETGGGGCADVRLLRSVESASISPDGQALAAQNVSTGVAFFDIDPATGALTQRAGAPGCATANGTAPDASPCTDLPTAFGGGTADFVTNTSLTYASGASGGQIAVFDRDFAPVCQPATVTVPFETSVAAPLSCTDANGHAITYEIVQHPTNGVLAAINQTAKTVAYDPFSGFSGTDSFTYRGNAFGASSAPATVTLNVAAKGQPVDPSAVDADGDGYPKSQDCDDANNTIHPGATDVPGNGIDEDCSGADAGSTAASKFNVIGDGNAGRVRVNRKGVFFLKGHKVNCSGPGPDCAVKTKVKAKLATTSAKRTVKIGGSKFTVKTGTKKRIKSKLTKKGLKRLKKLKRIRAKVVVTVTRGAEKSKRTVKVKLLAPKKRRS